MTHPVYRVTGFEIVGLHTRRVEFNDATAQVIDFSDVLAGDIYGPLQDEQLFRGVEIDPEIHTLVWPSGADFDPAVLHDWPAHANEMRRLAKRWGAARPAYRRAVSCATAAQESCARLMPSVSRVCSAGSRDCDEYQPGRPKHSGEDPEAARAFRDSASVNDAPRSLLAAARASRRLAVRSCRTVPSAPPRSAGVRPHHRPGGSRGSPIESASDCTSPQDGVSNGKGEERSNMSDLRKVAIVTGAGSGIGKATALALLREGWSVVLAGRRAEVLAAAVTEAGPLGWQALAVPTDVSEPVSVRTLFAKTKETFGRLDLLFNNAGTSAPPIPLEDLTYEQWKSVVDVNLTGAFLCTQEAFKLMKSQTPRGGRIINNGSVSAHVPRPNSAPYTATKHAMTGLTKATALDGRKYDIACGQIDIGNAETTRTARMKTGVPQAHGAVAVEPVMDVQHVARAVVHMASLPLDANVQFLTIMATKMPFIGRG